MYRRSATIRRLGGRTVLITGAARGIGAQTARQAVAAGARVALAGLEPERLEALAAELASAGGEACWFECDVTRQSDVDNAVRGAVERFGRLDTVVANAGIASIGTVAVSDVEALVRTVDVNLVGVMRTVAATIPHLVANRGYYLLISSTASFAVMPGMAAYCGSKAGVEHFGHALRLELRHHGVQVGTAHPCWTDTDMVRDAKDDVPEFRDALRRLPGPLGSYTSAEDCAAALVDAIARRRRRIYVPRSIAAVQALRSAFVSPLAELIVGRVARTSIPRMEREIRALGRSFGRNSTESIPPVPPPHAPRQP